MKIIWEEDDVVSGQQVQRVVKLPSDDDARHLITHSPSEDDWNLVNLTTGRYVAYSSSKGALLKILNDGFWPVEFLDHDD